MNDNECIGLFFFDSMPVKVVTSNLVRSLIVTVLEPVYPRPVSVVGRWRLEITSSHGLNVAMPSDALKTYKQQLTNAHINAAN